ncbi:MAG: hypothetical protein SF187_09370 [Deltaproteobacteria bacterium]|nr:hypothetical protein [Deltaproteobacteria bacterium]
MSHEDFEESVDGVAPRAPRNAHKTWLILLAVWGGLALLIGLNMN